MAAALELSDAFRGPVLVTVAFFVLWYYLLLGLQRGTKYRLRAEYRKRGEEFDRYFTRDGRMLAADRAVANTQEQMPAFLVGLWLYAALVSADTATILGSVYVVLRSLYPRLLGASVEKANPKRVFAVTGPCYAIVFYFLLSSAHAVW